MTDSLSIGWTRAAAAGALKSYKRLYGFNLGLHGLIALVAVVGPGWVLDILAIPAPEAATDWVRVWALMVLMASAFQVPGYLNPLFNRMPNVIGILGQGAMTVLYLILGGGFLWLALFDGALALALAVRYRRLVIAELQCRP